MDRFHDRTRWHPGLRALVLTVSGVLIMVAAILVSANVADHLQQTAVAEAVRATEAVVHGYIDPSVTPAVFANPSGPEGAALNAELQRLASAGTILRIKVWAADGTVVFSDLAALRGRRFPPDDDLTEVFEGNISTQFSDASDEENVFERGLADEFLSMYLPIRSATGDGPVLGAYEVYEDAGPIVASIRQSRQDVLLIVGGMALGLLALLYAAFSVASRRLTSQNRRLVEQSIKEQILTTDLRRSQERFRSLVQNSADVNMILGADGTIEYESPAVERVLGFDPDDRTGRSAFGGIHPDDRSWGEALLADVVRSPSAMVAGEFRVQHADGSWRWIEAVGKNLFDDPAVGGVVVNYRDITSRKTLEEELRHQAFHDSLTGLANRALFVDRPRARPVALAPGPAAARRPVRGPRRLQDDQRQPGPRRGRRDPGQRRRAAARGPAVGRHARPDGRRRVRRPRRGSAGGQRADGRRRSDRRRPAGPFTQGGKELFVHASVGVAVVTSRDQTADELLRNADVSMYIAKRKGKNRIEVFEPSMHAAALARLALKGDLERALERDEFFVLYQPVMDLSTLEIVGVEALVRWRHPERGVVAPLTFIPVAEETGLIIELGRWVLLEACRQAEAWRLAAPTRSLTMNVNVSGRQVTEPGFVAEVAGILTETGLDPTSLVLEFTEGVLMQDTEATMATLRDLKALGIRLAIDDFGTGYSSLSYVRQFPIDVLKIDRSFVASMSDGPDETALLHSILQLSETLHLETVAEGIEDAGQLSELQLLGADLGQGFLFAQPLESSEIAAILAQPGRRLVPETRDRGVA